MSNKQTCILVLGMHRSGTSALTGTLSLLDVYLGSKLMKGSFANEKGYFENDELFSVNEALLAECHSSWYDIFYSEDKLEKIKNIDELKAVIKKEFEYSRIFAIKDPRLAFLFPIYKKILEEFDIDIKVVLPYRNPMEVANSLHTRDNLSLEKGMLLWGYHFLLAEKYSRDYERVFINYDDLMNKTEESIRLISQSLNIDFYTKYTKNKQRIEEFLEPSLKHHNIAIDNLSHNVPVIVQKILALQDQLNNKSSLKKFDVLRNELFSYQKLFYNREIVSSLQELTQTKEMLSQREQELTQSKKTLTNKEQLIAKKDTIIMQQAGEIEALKDELTFIYTGKSWKITRILRKLKRYFA